MIDKRLLEAIGEANRARRMLDDLGGLTSAARQFEEATRAHKALEALGGPDRFTKQVALAQNADILARRYGLIEDFERIEAARRVMQPALSVIDQLKADKTSMVAQAVALRLPDISLPDAAYFKTIENAQQVANLVDTTFHPTVLATQQLAERISQLTEPHRRFAENISGWSKSLELRIGQIDAAWAVRNRLGISGLAFASLAQFSDSVRYDAPFSEETNELVAEELGDVVVELDDAPDAREAQYDAVGRNPSLVAFPEPAYDRVILASGFVLEFPAAPMPQPIENGGGTLRMDDIHHAAMRDIENHLRVFIVRHLSAVEPRWEKQRVPGDMLKKWRERQEADRALGRAVFGAIYYADLAELGQIIGRNDNWMIFQPFFEARDGLLVSLSRLTPIRNAIAHGRPLSQTDVLCIAAEGARLLRAIGLIGLN